MQGQTWNTVCIEMRPEDCYWDAGAVEAAEAFVVVDNTCSYACDKYHKPALSGHASGSDWNSDWTRTGTRTRTQMVHLVGTICSCHSLAWTRSAAFIEHLREYGVDRPLGED